MSEELCVCGRSAAWHKSADAVMSGMCSGYRPCLPWPDSPGLWWCDNEDIGYVEADPFAIIAGEVREYAIHIRGVSWHEDDFADGYSPARFVKLLETSPFKEPEI